jgi:O-antigen/teichoic acid export membrane protein
MIVLSQLKNLTHLFFKADENNRGRERWRRVGLTGMTAMLAQGLAIAIGFISVPLTLGYLGNERYGIWLTINSLLQWLYIGNLGMGGNALINALSEANGKDDKKTAQELVATAFWSLTLIAIFLLIIFSLLFSFIPWTSVFNVTENVSVSELNTAVFLSFFCFVFMFPVSLVEAVYYGYQEGFISNVWNLIASVFSLIALIIVTQFQGGLPLLVVALFGIRIFVSIVNAVYLFFIRHPWLVPKFQFTTRDSFKRLIGLGATYLVAQLSSICMIQSQPMMITQIMGPNHVGLFNVTQRLISLPTFLLKLLVNPFMPAYGEAKARNDWAWIKRTLRRTLFFSLLVIVFVVIPLSLFSKWLMNLWVGDKLIPSDGLIVFFALYVATDCLAVPLSVMLFGLEKVKGQANIATLNAILLIALGIPFTYKWGLTGLAFAMLAAFFSMNLIGQIIHAFSTFRNTSQNETNG